MPDGPQEDQRREGTQQQPKVQYGLRARPEPRCEGVSISVARQQQRLKEQHARGPHRSGTTKPRQEVFTQQEFNPEKQKGAREYRESEAQWSTPFPVRPVIGDRRCLGDHKPRSSHRECIYAR